MAHLASIAALSAALLAPAPAFAGEAMLGVTEGPAPEIVRFDAAAPQTPAFRAPLQGLLAGETVEGIDQRAATGQILALTSINRVLLLDALTGALSQPGLPIEPALLSAGQAAGVDVNPAADRLRLVNAANDNLRFNPLTFAPVDGDTGAAGVQGDAPLAYIVGDPNAGADPAAVAAAYDRNDNDPGTATTLFAVDGALDALVRQGAVDGNAADAAGGASPNGGLLTTIGPLGVDSDGSASFDIAGPPGGGGAGWAALRQVGQAASTLYAIDLTPGPVAARANALGVIGGGPLVGMTVLRGGVVRPAPPPPAGEGAAQAVVRIERGGETLAPASLSFRTADRTAVAGRDYLPVAGTLDFAQGERAKDVAVPLVADAAPEPGEALALELGTPTGGAVLDPAVVAVEIADDDFAAGADRTRPGYIQVARRPRSLDALRRTPVMRVRVACTEACRIRLTLRLKRLVLGTGRASLPRAGTRQAVVRLSRGGRRALVGPSRLAGSAVLVLRATATDPAGNVTTRRTSLRVPRS